MEAFAMAYHLNHLAYKFRYDFFYYKVWCFQKEFMGPFDDGKVMRFISRNKVTLLKSYRQWLWYLRCTSHFHTTWEGKGQLYPVFPHIRQYTVEFDRRILYLGGSIFWPFQLYFDAVSDFTPLIVVIYIWPPDFHYVRKAL